MHGFVVITGSALDIFVTCSQCIGWVTDSDQNRTLFILFFLRFCMTVF